ncbi:MAG TPA: hypothetical protein VJN64_09415 [Terriglobales bacterium]|nr:hypothetical protein [Terriglobales bacterium]
MQEIAKEGRKFFIDMTDVSGASGEAYVGLDFGTSNTAISYIDKAWVGLTQARSRDAGWKELGELVELLPTPLAVPLARFIGDHHYHDVVPPGQSFLEAGLCLAAYVSYVEFCSTSRRAVTRLFSRFPHRSASYLWKMLKEVQLQLGRNAVITAPFKKLCGGENEEIFEQVTRLWAQARHELATAEKDKILAAVRVLANMSHEVFCRYHFGFFQHVQKEAFASRYRGRFRVTHGKPPHTRYFQYSGTNSFSEAEAFVVSTEKSVAMPLAPFIFWYQCPQHRDLENGHCFLFDKLRGNDMAAEAIFKAANHTCHLTASAGAGELSSLVRALLAARAQDPQLEQIENVRLASAE